MRKLLSLYVIALMIASMSTATAQNARKKLETDASDRTPANTIDFNAELQVPLQALSHLGETIEEAREEADPVCIASAANILAAAESMADGKKAKLTAADLWTEAIELAEIRNSSAELSALALLASGDKVSDLKERSEAAKVDEEAAKKEAKESNATSRDLNGDLHIYNRSHEYVRIYINGRYYGGLAPHSSTEIHVHHAHVLEAHSKYHLWHEHIERITSHYDWVIRDPHHPH